MATESFFCPPAWECEFLVSAGKQVIIVFSRKYVRGRLQVRARTVAGTCEDGCRYLRPRRAKLALEAFSCMNSDGLKKAIITCNGKTTN